MPKAKFKRKGAPLEFLQKLEDEDRNKIRKPNVVETLNGDIATAGTSRILLVPEEIICMILEHLPGTIIRRL